MTWSSTNLSNPSAFPEEDTAVFAFGRVFSTIMAIIYGPLAPRRIEIKQPPPPPPPLPVLAPADPSSLPAPPPVPAL
jgi:hypothetical protein